MEGTTTWCYKCNKPCHESYECTFTSPNPNPNPNNTTINPPPPSEPTTSVSKKPRRTRPKLTTDDGHESFTCGECGGVFQTQEALGVHFIEEHYPKYIVDTSHKYLQNLQPPSDSGPSIVHDFDLNLPPPPEQP